MCDQIIIDINFPLYYFSKKVIGWILQKKVDHNFTGGS